jgi:UDP-N-acetylglucosamine:LPS N-acetylglucosamine transferase
MVKEIFFIRNKDLQIIYQCGKNTAYKRMKIIKDTLNKTRIQKVTIYELAQFENTDVEMLKRQLDSNLN